MKRMTIAWIIMVMLLLSGCQKAPQAFDGEAVWAHLEYLSHERQNGRFPGTAEHDQAASYISDAFEAMGLLPDPESGSYMQFFTAYVPELEFPPLFEIVDQDGRVKDVFVHRTDYAEITKVFSHGGIVEGGLTTYCGPDCVKSGETSILLLPDSGMDTDGNRKQWLQSGVSAVIRPMRSELRGKNQNRLIKSVYLGSRSPELAQSGLVSLTVTDKTMETLVKYAELGHSAKINIPLSVKKVEGINVFGIIEGTDPELKNETVLVTAHYDHVGTDPDGSVYPGALDNASGVATMLELARCFADSSPKRTMVFVAFDAEESGLQGSKHFAYQAGDLILPLETTSVINLDMIGSAEIVDLTLSTDYRTGLPGSSKERLDSLVQTLEDASSQAGIPLVLERNSASSDHMSFLQRGVPAVTLSHMDTGKIHTPEDTIDNCSLERMNEVGYLLIPVLNQLVNQRRGTFVFFLGSVSAPMLIGVLAWMAGLAVLIWGRILRRKRSSHRVSLLASFLSVTVMFLIVFGTHSDLERDLPASLAPTPWNRVVSVDLPGIQKLTSFISEGDLVCIARTSDSEQVLRFDAMGKRMGRKDLNEAGSSQKLGGLGQTDDQGRIHMIFSELDGTDQDQLFYRWSNGTGTMSQPVFLTKLERDGEWTFAMDQAIGMVFVQEGDKTFTIKFPLGTNRARAVSRKPFVIHDASGALVQLREVQVLDSKENRISIAASGTLPTGESLIEQCEFLQGKMASHRTIYLTEEGRIEGLSAESVNGYEYLAWMDQKAENVHVISSNPWFGGSPVQTSFILAVSTLIQSFVQGMMVLISRIYWIFPGCFLMLILAIRREEIISSKGALLAICMNLVVQVLLFDMPGLFGVASEHLLATIGMALIVAVIVWLYGLERGECSPFRRFLLFAVLNLFFISMLYASQIFESGLERLDQTEFYHTQSERLNQ